MCLFISFCTHEIDSTPPAAKMSPSPVITRCAAMAIVCRPDEQKRLTVIPDVVTGQPARMRDLPRDVAAGRAFRVGAAHDDVLDLARIEPRALDRVPQRVAAHRGAVGDVERALPALAERRARGGDDDGIRHPVTLTAFAVFGIHSAHERSRVCRSIDCRREDPRSPAAFPIR